MGTVFDEQTLIDGDLTEMSSGPQNEASATCPDSRPFRPVIELLRTAGLRPTRQRLALAKLLFEREQTRHVTAETLHEEAASAGVRVSLATVYNTLHQFTRAGLLQEVVVDPGRTYFDTNVLSHHHFYNQRSGGLWDIEPGAVEITKLPTPPEGLSIDRVDLVIRVDG